MISSANKNFRPNDTITRAEAMKILMVALGTKTDGIRITFTDLDASSDLAKYVEAAKSTGIVSGEIVNGKARFRPNDAITRAEIAKIVAKAFGL